MSMFTALAVAAVLSAAPEPADASLRPVVPAAIQDDATNPAVRLEDVVVEGRPLNQMIRDFVEGVAQPNFRRGLARWTDRVCVSVIGMERDGADYIVDRVTDIASDLDIPVGGRGCTPNVMIVGTNDGNETAREMVRIRREVFYTGATGTNQSRFALSEFQENDRPVRWWQVSMPINSETGQRAVRLSGDCDSRCESATPGSGMGMAPTISGTSASRLRSQVVDNMQRTVVIVDVDQVAHLSANQLADYIALISLAQIDPNADTSGYASILNVIRDPESTRTLTDWDEAYLVGLYRAPRHQLNRMAGRQQIVDAIRSEHNRLRDLRTEAD